MADSVAVSRKFRDLTGGEKLLFVGKVCVFILTFGFVFPTILND